MKLTLLAVLACLPILVTSQNIEYTLSIPNDTTKNYYVTIHPDGEVKGSVVVLPGFGELPRRTVTDWDFHKDASDAGYLTIIPALGDWSFFYMDERSNKKLDEFIDEVFIKYNLTEDTFFIGGASLGGTLALQYTERAYRKESILKKPAGVFAIDPPLDIERLYDCMTTTNRPDKNPISIQEDTYVARRIVEEFGASPAENPELFWNYSPYANSDPEHRSLKSILGVPVRIYNEPDINWYIDNRSTDYRCINAIDSAAMINWLRALGNEKATLIVTSGKGYRVSQSLRHPHSWTIADGVELVAWMNRSVR